MKKSALFAILILSTICFAAGIASAQTVTGSIGDGSIERGDSTRGRIVLNIPGGLHVNSSRPASDYAIPTVVTVRAPRGVRVSSVTYPRGRNRKFQFSETLINVYEGRVSFPFTVTVPASFPGSTIRVIVAVRYQACTEEVCYAPKTKNIVLTARVS